MNPRPAPNRPVARPTSRRRFLGRSARTLGVAALMAQTPVGLVKGASHMERRMKICLTPGSIGVSANQQQAITLAAKHGFEAVEPFGSQLAELDGSSRHQLKQELADKHLAWGAAGLTVDFRKDDDTFESGLERLPKIAMALVDAGVTRVGTWLMPCHESLTYLQNFRLHRDRIRQVAMILKDNGLSLGLEYVGTHTLWTSRRYPFVHSLHETRELIEAIGTGNVGFVLDSWHWWQAGDSAEDILSLSNTDVVSVDLNDAPAGVRKTEQIDGRRELPAATGVIDLNSFVSALQKIGYDGPVRPEPFNQALRDLGNDEACSKSIAAMRKGLTPGR